MISIGSKEMVDCQVGSKKVKEIYVGSKKVWPTSLWSGTIDNSQALGEIVTIPNFSANTKITITLQYISGTWNTNYPGSFINYYIKGKNVTTVNPPLSSQNPKFTFTTDVYYATSQYQGSSIELLKLIGDNGTYSRSLQLVYNSYTGVMSINFYIPKGDTITPPLKDTITTN